MIDAVIGDDGGAPSVTGGDWRAALRGKAVWLRRQVLRHPWVPRLLP